MRIVLVLGEHVKKNDGESSLLEFTIRELKKSQDHRVVEVSTEPYRAALSRVEARIVRDFAADGFDMNNTWPGAALGRHDREMKQWLASQYHLDPSEIIEILARPSVNQSLDWHPITQLVPEGRVIGIIA